ncbi:MAG: hypothetical protein HZB76_07515 [Chlamydiae bacterium]|nr:hypothetical protein [Chlamydiota bacterium]
MMLITIHNKLEPFSHISPVAALLPNTLYQVTIYPTLIVFKNFEKTEEFKLFLDLKGPVEPFTIFLDLEKKGLTVKGFSQEGYFCYHLFANEEKVSLLLEKGPKSGIDYSGFKKGTILPKHTLDLPIKPAFPKPTKETLSLGMNKALDFDMIKRRADLKEIFPIWYRLAELIVDQPKTNVGTAKLLENCQELIEKKDRVNLEKAFLKVFKAAFFGMMVPRLNDEYQGIVPLEEKHGASPIYILKEGAKLIRSMFFMESENTFSILPSLPVGFHSGRFINIQTAFGSLDIEWSKKLLRQMVFKAAKDFSLKLNLQKPIDTFRVRLHKKDKGKNYLADDVIPIKANTAYFFDRFQK